MTAEIVENTVRLGLVVRTSVFGWRTFPDLHLIYGWRDHFVGKVSAESTNQANSAFYPFWVGKWVTIHVFTWITGVETIKLHTEIVHMVV